MSLQILLKNLFRSSKFYSGKNKILLSILAYKTFKINNKLKDVNAINGFTRKNLRKFYRYLNLIFKILTLFICNKLKICNWQKIKKYVVNQS